MIAKPKPKTAGLIPAATYIRMSGDHQERSPAQQEAELERLAKREGLEIVQAVSDEAISGDTGSDQRSGLAALLQAVRAGTIKVVLAWHTNRLSRQDPMDALELYNVLRKAHCRLVTCCEGVIDLDDFAKQLLLFVNQKASKDYLVEHSAKVLRGQRATAESGGRCGGPVPYGFERAEIDGAGNLVRRLEAKQPKSTTRGHRVRLVPVEDSARLAAVQFAFQRFASADLSVRALAAELHDKGFPAPNGSTWNHATLSQILRSPVYAGGTRWNRSSGGKYHAIEAGEIIEMNGRGGPRRQNDQADVIIQNGTHDGLVSRKLFQQVQRRLAAGGNRRYARRADFPLSGVIFCRHCGKAMHGTTEGTGKYKYRRYICQGYGGDKHRRTCGHFTVPAERVAKWLVGALQAEFGADGPGRAELVTEIKRQLRAGAKGSKQDTKRLTARLADLDLQVGRLVKAIKTTDIPELAAELAIVRRDREAAQEALRHAGRHQAPQDVDREADATADELGRLVGSLDDGDPATVRQVFGLLVSKITCSWEQTTCRSGRQRCKLVEGEVELRNLGLQSVLCGGVAHVGA